MKKKKEVQLSLQRIKPILHAFLQARFSPDNDLSKILLEHHKTRVQVSLFIVKDDSVTMVPYAPCSHNDRVIKKL
jgi:hypothetical protein